MSCTLLTECGMLVNVKSAVKGSPRAFINGGFSPRGAAAPAAGRHWRLHATASRRTANLMA